MLSLKGLIKERTEEEVWGGGVNFIEKAAFD